MSRSSSTHRRLAHRGVARRLRVEAMENRLMLSAAPLNFVQEYSHPVLLTPNAIQSTVSLAQPIRIVKATEGGFVFLTSGHVGQSFEGIAPPNYFLSDATADHFISIPISGKGNSDAFDSALRGANFNVQPAIIGPVYFKPIGGPVSVSGGEPTAGGTIPIEPILGGIETIVGPRMAKQPETTSPTESVSELQPVMNFPAPSFFKSVVMTSKHLEYSGDDVANSSDEITISSDNDVVVSSKDVALSGELARAIVFEITGGEPMKLDRPATGERQKWATKPTDAAISREGEPLSFKSDSKPAVTYPTGGHRFDDRGNDWGLSALSAVGPIEFTKAVVARMNSLALANNRANTAPLATTSPVPECDANPEELGISDFHAAGLVLADEYEQLSDSDNAPSFAEYDWQTVFEATLVVLVLSQEQSVSRKSREDDKGAATLSMRPLPAR